MSAIVNEVDSLLNHFPPMGVYETLFKFRDATGSYMGTDGTHPWAQGFPVTSPLPNGPDIPLNISFTYTDLKYPSATGEVALLNAIRDYYNHFYGSNITTDNIAVFAGGRPAIYATLAFLKEDTTVLVEETEYTPYWDALNNLKKKYKVIQSNESNNFRPDVSTYKSCQSDGESVFLLKSNPCNPTGVTLAGEELKQLVDFFASTGNGGIFDEAYEFMASPAVSAMQHIGDINATNLFVVSAATKGLQAPGLRIGWVVSSVKNTLLFRNFRSIAMGGCSRPSQICCTALLALDRVAVARRAVSEYYESQRKRYEGALIALGFQLFTGTGGFYHWAKLPNNLTAEEFNNRLFKYKAGILPGTLCDMHRKGASGGHARFIRFSFGPLKAESFEDDIEILRKCVCNE